MMPRRISAGFTLLEILVAFIVLAIVGGSLLQLFQGGMRNVAHATDYSHAALLARSKLSELEAYPEVAPGEQTGDFDERYRWRLRVEPYRDPGGAPTSASGVELMAAELSVSWGEDREQRSLTVETLLFSAVPGAGGG
jgi:general secretion pathway protein I